MSKNTTTYSNIEDFSKVRRRGNKKYYKKTAIYERRGWTEQENKLVLKQSITDTELSKILKRSVMSIQVRRTRLKKLD